MMGIRLRGPWVLLALVVLSAQAVLAGGTVMSEDRSQVGIYNVFMEEGQELQHGDLVSIYRGEEKVGEAYLISPPEGRTQINLRGVFEVRSGDTIRFEKGTEARTRPAWSEAEAAQSVSTPGEGASSETAEAGDQAAPSGSTPRGHYSDDRTEQRWDPKYRKPEYDDLTGGGHPGAPNRNGTGNTTYRSRAEYLKHEADNK